MLENARSALRLFGCASTLVLASAGCSSAPGPVGGTGSTSIDAVALPAGVLPMGRAMAAVAPSAFPAAREEPAAAKHCCIVIVAAESGTGSVEVYHNAHPYKHVGRVKYPGQDPDPQTVAVSSGGVVYVGDLRSHAVYAFGNGYRKAPSATYPQTNPSGTAVPRSLAVGHDDTLYVSDELYTSGSPTGNLVEVFPSGSAQPYTLQGPPNATGTAGVAVDAQNNVYIAAEASLPSDPSQEVVQVIQYAPGSSNGQVRNLVAPPNFQRAMAVDAAGNLLIGDTNASCGAVFVFSPGQTMPSRILGTSCSSGLPVTGLVLTSHKTLYFSTNELQVQEYSYPSGKPRGVLFVQNVAQVVGLGEGPAFK